MVPVADRLTDYDCRSYPATESDKDPYHRYMSEVDPQQQLYPGEPVMPRMRQRWYGENHAWCSHSRTEAYLVRDTRVNTAGNCRVSQFLILTVRTW